MKQSNTFWASQKRSTCSIFPLTWFWECSMCFAVLNCLGLFWTKSDKTCFRNLISYRFLKKRSKQFSMIVLFHLFERRLKVWTASSQSRNSRNWKSSICLFYFSWSNIYKKDYCALVSPLCLRFKWRRRQSFSQSETIENLYFILNI